MSVLSSLAHVIEQRFYLWFCSKLFVYTVLQSQIVLATLAFERMCFSRLDLSSMPSKAPNSRGEDDF